jgi:hypothetical protein
MKTLFVLLTFFLLLISLQAHPSWAFIMDENEKIYLVDLLTDDGTLMQIDLKTQELKVVATGFHCHSMHLGKDGNIYAGLNIWRQGEIEGEGHNYLICIDTEDGSLDTLLFSERYLDYFGADIAMTEDLSLFYISTKTTFMRKLFPISLPGNGSIIPLKRQVPLLWMEEEISGSRIPASRMGPYLDGIKKRAYKLLPVADSCQAGASGLRGAATSPIFRDWL